MFTWLNNHCVKSYNGFIVQSINRFVIEYRESGKVIKILVKRALLKNGKTCIFIKKDEVKKWSDETSIADEKQN